MVSNPVWDCVVSDDVSVKELIEYAYIKKKWKKEAVFLSYFLNSNMYCFQSVRNGTVWNGTVRSLKSKEIPNLSVKNIICYDSIYKQLAAVLSDE